MGMESHSGAIQEGIKDHTEKIEEEKAKETAQNFTDRVEQRSGLKINRIPDAAPEVMFEGAIIASSDHGKLVYTDHSHQDADGGNIYNKAVLVNRSKELLPADPDADGLISDL